MARARERLKPRTIEVIKHAGYYPDGAGLYLQVSESGSKSWVFRFMLAGRAREMGLGPAHVFSLADARERAAEQRKLLADGIDPIEARKAQRARSALELAKSKTFGECAAAYIAEHRSEWKNAKHAGQWETTIATFCKPILALPVQGVDTGQVLGVLKPIWNEARETAVRLRGRIEKILDSAKTLGYREGDNPARWRGHLQHLLAKDNRRKRIQHHAALPFAKIGGFMRELRAQEGIAARALEFTILNASRTGEVIGAQWREIDLSAATWTIAAERMKGGREHRAPLSPAAVALLKALPRVDDYVFPGRRADKGLSNMAMLALLKRIGRGDLTTHGMRSCFRDWASECTNFPPAVCEMALAHVISDDTEAAYRRGDLFEKRRKLMNAWAAYVNAPAAGAKVTPIRRAAA